MKKFLIAALALAALSCTREVAQDEPVIPRANVTISAIIPETRTALGDPEGSTYPNYWSEGDVIAVNGVNSQPLGSECAGAAKASFVLSGVETPYRAVCPASAASDWTDNGVSVVIPSQQTWQAGTYDPAAFLMTGTSDDGIIAFKPEVALFKVVPNAAAGVKIASVKISALNANTCLSGTFSTNFSGLTAVQGAVQWVSVSSSEGIPAGEPIILAMAPADFSTDGLSIEITDTDGGSMVRTAVPSKPYVSGKMYKAEIDYVPESMATGNIRGRVVCGNDGVPGVLISDGIEIVQTDADGYYSIQSEKYWGYVFMIIPSGYEVYTDGILPKMWKPISTDKDVVDTQDFELVQVSNDNYTLFVLGDMHLARRTNDLAQFEKVAGHLRKAMNAAGGKSYVLTLGDMTWDMYWIANNYGFGDYLLTVNSYFAGIPFFHTMGNHDNEMEVAGDYLKAIKYTQNLAPDYYSFNLGKIHYIVLDNMDFTGVEAGEDNRSKYAKNYTADQLEWLRKDLSYVDKSTPVFVTSHEPLARPSGLNWNEELNGKDADLSTFMGIFDGYNVRFLSGHTHNTFFRRYSPTFVEHNSGAVCASWWWSGKINPGIHIAQDGAPGGYTVWTVNGTDCTHYYQSACQPREYQFRAYDMNQVKATITSDLSSHDGYLKYYNHVQGFGDNIILVNVWDYDEDWKVEISENGTPLSVSEVGVYDPLHIYAMTIPRLNDYNTTTFSTAKWRHFFQATASAADTPVTVTVTDRYGNVYTETMDRPKAFTIDEYKNEIEYQKPQAKFVSASSSSLVFGWTVGGTAAEDAALPYKLELFRDSGCSDLVVSFDVPAGHSCWAGNALRFVFGGLQPSTTYYFKVHNSKNGDVSDVVSGTTDAFTVVDPSTITNAGVGDVILAEDFSEIAWGPDENSVAAGFFPSEKLLEPVTGSGEHSGGFVVYNSTGRRVYGDTKVTSDKRLYNWGFFGNSAVYAYNGQMRICTTASGARTHLVSPALSGIPEGKSATVDVTVTACPTYADNDVGVFINDHSALKRSLPPDAVDGGSGMTFSGYGGKFTGGTLSNGYALNLPSKKLTTSTVRIPGVTSSSCLLIGSLENVNTKNRFWISDVKVQIVSLEETPDISASFVQSSSSTLTFSWTEGVSAADDVSKPYTISLYSDAACSNEVVSFSIPANASCWKDKTPRFVFTGLESATTYWFKVMDTGSGTVSKAVSAATDAFTNVEVSSDAAAEGDVILAEDFGQMCWGADEVSQAAGYDVSDVSYSTDTGKSYTSRDAVSFVGITGQYAQRSLTAQATAKKESGFRLAAWAQGQYNRIYIGPGYLFLSTKSYGTHLITPALNNIPAGMKARVEVTLHAAGMASGNNAILAVQHGIGFNNVSSSSQTNKNKLDLASNTQTITFTGGITKLQEFTVTLDGLVQGDRIAFGPTSESASATTNMMLITDIIVRIAGLEDSSRTTKVSVIGDSISTFKGWSDSTKGGAYYPKSDGDVTSVSQTWWYRLIYSHMQKGTFEKNISAGNTTVVQNSTGDSSAYWYGWDFGTRLQQLGIGDPDIVLIHGGTNDYGHTSWYNTSEELITGVSMSSSSFPASAQDALDAIFSAADAATTVSAADALDGSNFCSAYTRLIRMIQTRHPSAKIVCVIGDYLRGGQGEAIKLIAQHFGDSAVRVADLLGENVSIPKYSNPHPNAAGMDAMAGFIYQKLGSWLDE